MRNGGPAVSSRLRNLQPLLGEQLYVPSRKGIELPAAGAALLPYARAVAHAMERASHAFAATNGVNLQPSYYNSGNVDFAWSLMNSNTAIKAVRIEIEPGSNASPGTFPSTMLAGCAAISADCPRHSSRTAFAPPNILPPRWMPTPR